MMDLNTIQETHPQELQAMQECFPEASMNDLVRFLQARNFHVEKAADMYQAQLEWRSETLPISLDSVKDTLATRKFYVLNHTDAEGHAVLFFSLHRFKEAPYVVQDEIQALLYLLETDVPAKMEDSSQQWTVLIDVSGIKSPPLAFLNQMNTVMEANYPERLFRTVMFPVPGWLERIIQTFLLFVDETTRNKFTYANDVHSLEENARMSMKQMGPDVAQLHEDHKL